MFTAMDNDVFDLSDSKDGAVEIGKFTILCERYDISCYLIYLNHGNI